MLLDVRRADSADSPVALDRRRLAVARSRPVPNSTWQTTSTSSCELRAITNVSARRSVAICAVSLHADITAGIASFDPGYPPPNTSNARGRGERSIEDAVRPLAARRARPASRPRRRSRRPPRAPTAGAVRPTATRSTRGRDVQPGRRSLDAASETAARAELGQTVGELPGHREGQGPARPSSTVPVWFHVVSGRRRIGNISDDVIQEQMNVLNLAFGGFYGGANTGFTFRLAGVTRTDNAAWHYAAQWRDAPMKRALHRGGPKTLNIYATTAGAYLGWAYLPTSSRSRAGLPRRHRRRLGVDARCVDDVRRPLRPRPDGDARGRPLAQPRAHVLRRLQREGRLRRRHAGEKVADDGCPDGKDTCRSRGSTRSTTTWTTRRPCYTEFTAGQTQRMRDASAPAALLGLKRERGDVTGRRKPARFRSG